MKYKFSKFFLVFVGAIVVAYLVFSAKVYPVATVNDIFISAKSFDLTASAATNYYAQALKVYRLNTSSTQEEFTSEMRRAALQSLIEDTLITAELQKTYEPTSLEGAITKRVGDTLASSTEITPEAIKTLFGLTMDDFKIMILAPRARQEILQHDLAAKHSDLETWLPDALARATVSIALTDLVWHNHQVESTNQPSYTSQIKKAFEQIVSSTAALTASSTASSSAPQTPSQ